MKNRIFNSKLLLFGEYGLIYNAMALSIPFSKYSAQVRFDDHPSHLESNGEIRKFYEYLNGEVSAQLHHNFKLDEFKSDLDKYLYFESNIPQQYGLGSSGALVAALFSQYANLPDSESPGSIKLLQTDFALLENYFHVKSSGIDPLISYLNKPLLIDSQKNVREVKLDPGKTGISMALIDTQTKGATGPLVQHFIGQFENTEFRTNFYEWFVPANNACIETLLNGSTVQFFLQLELLIRFQLRYFRQMIPGRFHALISEAIDRKVFIKLLGSGGGGFLLAFAESETILSGWANTNEVNLVWINE